MDKLIEEVKKQEMERIIRILADNNQLCPDRNDSLGYCKTYGTCEECFRQILKGE